MDILVREVHLIYTKMLRIKLNLSSNISVEYKKAKLTCTFKNILGKEKHRDTSNV